MYGLLYPVAFLCQGGDFKARGSLTYTGPKLVTSKSKRLVSVQIEQTMFSSDDLSKLQKLIDEDRPYRIRIQVCRLSSPPLCLLVLCPARLCPSQPLSPHPCAACKNDVVEF